MRIVRRLHLLVVGNIAVLFIITATLIWSWGLLNLALERQNYSRKVESQLNYLQTKIIKQQVEGIISNKIWIDFESSFSKLIKSSPKLTAREQTLQNSIERQNKSIGFLYMQLSKIDGNKAIKKHLYSRLLLQIKGISEDSNHQATLTEIDIRNTIERQITIIVIVLILSMGFLGFGTRRVTSLIKSSIIQLQDGVEGVIKGQYEKLTLSHQSFEFKSFVDKFNKMNTQLKNTTVSKDVLRQIVDERTEFLKALAGTDSLTQIANRRVLFERGSTEFSRARRHNESLALLILDYDFFKKVNDTFGHQVGDSVLIHLCRICEKGIRDIDFFARYGGEEFIILLPNCSLSDAMGKANHIQKLLAENPIYVNSQCIKIKVSIGAATITATHKQFEDLLKDADDALLIAKENGRNRVESIQ